MPTAHIAKPKHSASHAVDVAATSTTAIRFRRLPRTPWESDHHAPPAARSFSIEGAGFQNRSRPAATATHSAVWRRPASHAVNARKPSIPAAGSPKSHGRARLPPTRNWTTVAITTALRATRAKAARVVYHSEN